MASPSVSVAAMNNSDALHWKPGSAPSPVSVSDLCNWVTEPWHSNEDTTQTAKWELVGCDCAKVNFR